MQRHLAARPTRWGEGVDPTRWNDGPDVVEFEAVGDVTGRLSPYLGTVIVAELSCGSTISDVLGAATRESLMLEGWGADGPDGEICAVDCDFVQRLFVF